MLAAHTQTIIHFQIEGRLLVMKFAGSAVGYSERETVCGETLVIVMVMATRS